MIQTYQEIREQIKIVNEECLKHKKGHIQKIYSTTRYLVLSIRFPAKTLFLSLGRGKGYEGLWLGDKFPESSLRIQDSFLHFVRKHLMPSTLIGIEIDLFDRIIKINTSNYEGVGSLLLFWNARKLYFIHSILKDDNYISFCSWNGQIVPSKNPFELFDEVGRREIDTGKLTLDKKEKKTIHDLYEEEKERVLTKIVNPKVKGLKNKIKKIKGEIENLNSWSTVETILAKEDFNLDGEEKFVFQGVKVKFNKIWSHYKKVDKIYQKKKSIKKAIFIQKGRLEKAEEELLRLNSREELSAFKENAEIIRPVFKLDRDEKKNRSIQKKKEVNESLTYEVLIGIVLGIKLTLAIGKNAQGNDEIRSNFAKKNDFWFHINGYKSTHGILKVEKDQSLTPEVLSYLGSILADYSNLSIQEIPVLYTQVKNLKGVKGSPGKVIYKKQKEISVYYQKDWPTIFKRSL